MGERLFRIDLEPIKFWDVSLKAHYLGPRKYKNPITGEQEDRKPTILYGIKMLLDHSRVESNKTEEIQDSLLRYLPDKWAFKVKDFVERVRKAWRILLKGEKTKTEKFDYGKIRELPKAYLLSYASGKVAGWLYAVDPPDKSKEEVLEIIEENFLERGFHKGVKHFQHYKRGDKVGEKA